MHCMAKSQCYETLADINLAINQVDCWLSVDAQQINIRVNISLLASQSGDVILIPHLEKQVETCQLALSEHPHALQGQQSNMFMRRQHGKCSVQNSFQSCDIKRFDFKCHDSEGYLIIFTVLYELFVGSSAPAQS